MKIKKLFVLLCFVFLLTGCGAALELSIVGAGRSATAENTGFFISYDGIAPASDQDKKAYGSLPDLCYISPKIDMKGYKKVLVTDFTSRNTDTDRIAGLQSKYYKSLRKDLADNIFGAFDGSIFQKLIRTSEAIDPKDIEAITKLSADAILMGNIKELVAPLADEGGKAALAAAQVEYKLIDIKTGQEVLKAIHRSTTDKDKVATAQVRVLSALLKKAGEQSATAKINNSLKDSDTKTVRVNDNVNNAQSTETPLPSTNVSQDPPRISTKLLPSSATPSKSFICIKTANVRAAANDKSKIITTLKKGMKVEYIGDSGDWCQIKLASGATGWVFKDFIKEVR